MTEALIPVETIRYKTYLKEALVEGLKPVFANHADPLFQETKVTIETPFDEARFPSIVVRFYERQIKNAGVGHFEFFPDPDAMGRYIKYKHLFYSGDVEFAIYALSSIERDLLSDSLVQILAMGDIEAYTNAFLQRIYNSNDPAALDHMVNINTDVISGFGETQVPAPWQPEDVLVYQTAYRIGVFGEVYSRTPETDITNYGIIEKVDVFPYMPVDGEPVPDPNWPGPDTIYGTVDDLPDPAEWDGILAEDALSGDPLMTSIAQPTSPRLETEG